MDKKNKTKQRPKAGRRQYTYDDDSSSDSDKNILDHFEYLKPSAQVQSSQAQTVHQHTPSVQSVLVPQHSSNIHAEHNQCSSTDPNVQYNYREDDMDQQVYSSESTSFTMQNKHKQDLVQNNDQEQQMQQTGKIISVPSKVQIDAEMEDNNQQGKKQVAKSVEEFEETVNSEFEIEKSPAQHFIAYSSSTFQSFMQPKQQSKLVDSNIVDMEYKRAYLYIPSLLLDVESTKVKIKGSVANYQERGHDKLDFWLYNAQENFWMSSELLKVYKTLTMSEINFMNVYVNVNHDNKTIIQAVSSNMTRIQNCYLFFTTLSENKETLLEQSEDLLVESFKTYLRFIVKLHQGLQRTKLDGLCKEILTLCETFLANTLESQTNIIGKVLEQVGELNIPSEPELNIGRVLAACILLNFRKVPQDLSYNAAVTILQSFQNFQKVDKSELPLPHTILQIFQDNFDGNTDGFYALIHLCSRRTYQWIGSFWTLYYLPKNYSFVRHIQAPLEYVKLEEEYIDQINKLLRIGSIATCPILVQKLILTAPSMYGILFLYSQDQICEVALKSNEISKSCDNRIHILANFTSVENLKMCEMFLLTIRHNVNADVDCCLQRLFGIILIKFAQNYQEQLNEHQAQGLFELVSSNPRLLYDGFVPSERLDNFVAFLQRCRDNNGNWSILLVNQLFSLYLQQELSSPSRQRDFCSLCREWFQQKQRLAQFQLKSISFTWGVQVLQELASHVSHLDLHDGPKVLEVKEVLAECLSGLLKNVTDAEVLSLMQMFGGITSEWVKQLVVQNLCSYIENSYLVTSIASAQQVVNAMSEDVPSTDTVHCLFEDYASGYSLQRKKLKHPELLPVMKAVIMVLQNKLLDYTWEKIVPDGRFWICVLNIQLPGSAQVLHENLAEVLEALKSNSLITKVMNSVKDVFCHVKEQSCTVNQARIILVQEFRDMLVLMEQSLKIDIQYDISLGVSLDQLKQIIDEFQENIEHLQTYLLSACQGANNTSLYTSEFESKSPEDKVSKIIQENYWGCLSSILEPARQFFMVQQSQTFLVLWSQNLLQQDSSVEDCSEVVKRTRQRWLELWLEHSSERIQDITLSQVQELWGEKVTSVDEEISVVQNLERKIGPKQTMVDVLKVYMEFCLDMQKFHRQSLGDILLGLHEIFKVQFQRDFEILLNLFQTSANNGTAHQFATIYKQIRQSVQQMQDHLPLLWALSQGQELVSFISEIPEDQVYLLQEAVEEYSASFIRTADVEYFRSARYFVKPLMDSPNSAGTLPTFFHQVTLILRRQAEEKQEKVSVYSEALTRNIASCIQNISGLRKLYNNLANHQEVARETILKIQNDGLIDLRMRDGRVMEEKIVTIPERAFSLHELQDLRSRALLYVNSPGDSTESQQLIQRMEKYVVEMVDRIYEIVGVMKQLGALGHISYRQFERLEIESEELPTVLSSMQFDLGLWENQLQRSATKYYSLNFFHPEQLWRIYDTVMQRDFSVFYDTFQNLLGSVHMDISVTVKHMSYFKHLFNEFCLDTIGSGMQKIFEDCKLEPFCFPKELNDKLCSKNVKLYVQDGQVLVCSIENQDQIIHALMELYVTQEAYPQPSQVLFCTESTDWYAVKQFIQRALYSKGTFMEGQLFCILQADKLDYHVQSQLVNELFKKDLDFGRIAIISSKQSQIIEHVCASKNEHIRLLKGLSATNLNLVLSEVHSNQQHHSCKIKVLVSEAAGMGKSAFIERQRVKGESILYVPVRGKIDFEHLVPYLKDCNVYTAKQIHLDLAAIDNPSQANELLFRLLFLKSISSSSDAVGVRREVCVYVEVGNQLGDELHNALTIFSAVPEHNFCLHKEDTLINNYDVMSKIRFNWSLDDMYVDQSQDSDIQVVCNYLSALEKDTVNTQEIKFNEVDRSNTPNICHAQIYNQEECCRLLRQYPEFDFDNDFSFSLLSTFLKVLSQQLRYFSGSTFFKLGTLKIMNISNAQEIRKQTVQSLLSSCWKYTAVFVANARQSQQAEQLHRSNQRADEAMYDRTKLMLRWSNDSVQDNQQEATISDKIQVMFNLDGQCITAFYKDPERVPTILQNILVSQDLSLKIQPKGWRRRYQLDPKNLKDYSKMGHAQLRTQLRQLVGRVDNDQEQVQQDLGEHKYTITADNLLKMGLILRGIQSDTPVIMMGETGVGKTSLIKNLARETLKDEQLSMMCCDAGTELKTLKQFVDEVLEKTKKEHQIWVFLDEINTCRHMGVICDLICHKIFDGRKLPENVRMIAACNPYRLTKMDQETSGLEIRNNELRNRRSKLVYNVNPLPETMLNFVWDYGTLHKDDETTYIASMIKREQFAYCSDTLIEILAICQQFMRSRISDWSVSLRDVQRWIRLCKWFMKSFQSRVNEESQLDKKKPIILALAVAYQFRLSKQKDRNDFREAILPKLEVSAQVYDSIIIFEEEYYINKMQVQSYIAKNQYLMENVFVILVCVLNRLPLFIVGKPGSSKSLAIELNNTNLRGNESSDPLFRQLPKMISMPFQGSEYSTSEGIKSVFDRAQKLGKNQSEGKVIPVVVLDEVGLAEISPNNPLKALHSLLEPGYPKAVPDVAVVGISNWSLDAAKMNRAIVLQRTDPEQDDLLITSEKIWDSVLPSQRDTKIRLVAAAYHEYYTNQQQQISFRDFHGLRDFYSLIKLLSKIGKINAQTLCNAVARNFGGISFDSTIKTQRFFLQKVFPQVYEVPQAHVKDLIKENLRDISGRHLMVVGKGNEMMLDVLEQWVLKDCGVQVQRLRGSPFPGDRNDDYNYRILSQVILNMEQGGCLILYKLNKIYGALYDMLNQNYTIVADRKSCRIALGQHGRSMCTVHDNFRCIVVTEECSLQEADPPFLNRFEKQHLSFQDLFGDCENMLQRLKCWIQQFTNDDFQEFDTADYFIGYSEEMLMSLVLAAQAKLGIDVEQNEALCWCKEQLMKLVPLDALIRAKRSELYQFDYEDFCRWESTALEPLNRNLLEVVRRRQSCNEVTRSVIFTFSPVYQDISGTLNELGAALEKLTSFKKEADLVGCVEKFIKGQKGNTLILQCDLSVDDDVIGMARYTLDRLLKKYQAKKCHLFMLIHLTRERGISGGLDVGYFSGWEYVVVDNLERWVKEDVCLFNAKMSKILERNRWGAERILGQVLEQAVIKLQYPKSMDSIKHTRNVIEIILSDEELKTCFIKRFIHEVQGYMDQDMWQVAVANDRSVLHQYGSLRNALEVIYMRSCVNVASALLFVLESQFIFVSYEKYSKVYKQLVQDLFANSMGFLSIKNILKAQERQILEVPQQLQLRLPFSVTYFRKLESIRSFFEDEGYFVCLEEKELLQQVINRSDHLIQDLKHKNLVRENWLAYFYDFCDLICLNHVRDQKKSFCSVFGEVVNHQMKVQDFTQLQMMEPEWFHVLWWKSYQNIQSWLEVMSCMPEFDNKNMKPSIPRFCIHSVVSSILQQLKQPRDIPSQNMDQALSCMQFALETSQIKSFEPSRECFYMFYCCQFMRDLHPLVVTIEVLWQQYSEILNSLLLPRTDTFLTPQKLQQLLTYGLRLINFPFQSEKQKVLAIRCLRDFIQLVLSKKPFPEYAIVQDQIYQCILHEVGVKYMMPAAIELLKNFDRVTPKPPMEDQLKAQFWIPQLISQYLVSIPSIQSSLIVDAIQVYWTDRWLDNVRKKYENSKIQEVQNVLSQCLDIVLDTQQQTLLKTLCAVACLRSILDHITDYIDKSKRLIPNLRKLNQQLSKNSSRAEALKLYMLKRLYAFHSIPMNDIRRFCQLYNYTDGLPCLSSIMQDNVSIVNPSRARVGYLNSYRQLQSMLESPVNCSHLHSKIQAAIQADGLNFVLAVIEVSKSSELSQFEQSVVQITGSLDRSALGKLLRQSVEMVGSSESSDALVESLYMDAIVTACSLEQSGHSKGNNWLIQLLEGTLEDIGTFFIPGMPINEQEAVLAALQEKDKRFSRFTCNTCGYMYIVGECRRSKQTTICPDCKQTTIGGIGNNVTRVDQKDFVYDEVNEDVMGYIVEEPATTKPNRQLAPLVYRIIHLTVHALLLANVRLPRNDENDSFSIPSIPDNIQQFLMEHMQNDLTKISKLTDLNLQDSATFIHAVYNFLQQQQVIANNSIITADGRKDAEQYFQQLVLPLVQNVNTTVLNFMEKIGTQSEIQEIGVSQSGESDLANLLRARARISKDSLRSSFYNNPNNRDMYPFLHDLFQAFGDSWDSTITYVFYLPDLVQWVQQVKSRLQYQQTWEGVCQMNSKDFIRRAGPEHTDLLQKQFDKFVIAWNKCRHKIDRYECQTLEIPEIIGSCSMALCCYSRKSEGKMLMAMLQSLACAQNEFLQKCAERAQDGCSVVNRILKCEDGILKCPFKNLRNVMYRDVFDITPDDFDQQLTYKGLAVAGLSHGQGCDIMYDYQQIQSILAQQYLQGVVFINETDEEFVFHRYLFIERRNLFQDIEENVQQEDLKVPLEDIVQELQGQGLTQKHVLDDLESIMSFLQKTSKDIEPRTTVGQLVQAWFSKNYVEESASMKCQIVRSIPVSQVVALYKVLEAHEAENVQDFIANVFKPETQTEALPEVVKNQLDTILVKEFPDYDEVYLQCRIRVDDMRLVLRQFAYRYLQSDTGGIEAEEQLGIYLENSMCIKWPPNAIQGLQVGRDSFIPQQWKVKHVWGMLQYIEEKFFVQVTNASAVEHRSGRQRRR